MKIKKIVLDNIRSYEHQEIIFPEGSVLLSGDIGSGKTSVLLGIEFALFGLQPGQKGSAILRNGAQTGGVSIEFEVDDKTVLIERTLKKAKAISQDYSAITLNGEKQELSVTELKNKVLDILKYPKEFAKKQNILYKFTVYTPQEEMKQIILEDAETRLNTLRYVFGIDKYKKIIENSSVILTKIKEEKRFKEALVLNLENDKQGLIDKERELDEKNLNLISIEKDLFLKSQIRSGMQEEISEISKKIEEKSRLNQEVEKSKIMVSTKNNSIQDNLKLIKQLREQISALEKFKFEESKFKELERDVLFLKENLAELNEKNLDISSKINSFIIRNEENDKVKKNLKHLENCPTCLQTVDPNYKANVLLKIESEITENINKIKELTLEKQKVMLEVNKVNYDISSKEKEIQDLKIVKVRLQGLVDKKDQILNLEKYNSLMSHDIEFLNGQIHVLQTSIIELSKFDKIFEEKQRNLREAMQQEKLAEIKVAELKRDITFFSKNIKELKEKISKTEQIKDTLNYLSELENWISKSFLPLVSNIEKNVMIKLKSDFSNLFSEWFAMLVSDNFNVRLDDDFTPIIEQQDYEIDYAYLSGGERTAIALAYRLSLNQVINSLLSKIKTKDLVILDEPTDGFSEQQLDKMRSVLEELNIGQLIIVSHEQKIEGFVDNVIRFRKEKGISEVGA
jgi:DNA repair protein SbcC/Rad50